MIPRSARRPALTFVALLSVFLCVSCRRSAAPSAPAVAPRLAVLSPALAVTLRDLGLERLVVARHAFDMVLPADLPVVGDQAGLDYEALLRAAPTHVLLEWGSRELPPRLTALAKERGWVLRNYRLLTLDDIRAAVRSLPDDTGAPEARDRAADLLRRMNEAWRPRPGLGSAAGRTLLLYSLDPPAAAGPGSFHEQLLRALGARPAITQGPPYITLDVEDVRRLNADSIVLILPGAEPLTRREQLGRLGEIGLRSVNAGRVLILNDRLAQTPSTAMIDLADALARGVLAWRTPANAPDDEPE